MTQHVIVAGNPVDGFTFHGPFDDDGDAYLFAEGLDADWVLARCQEPPALLMIVTGPTGDETEQQYPHAWSPSGARCTRSRPGGLGCRIAGSGDDNGPCEEHPDFPQRHLVCPKCDMRDEVIVVDIAVRENASDVEPTDDGEGFLLNVHQGDGDFQTNHYLCGNCRARVTVPEGTEEHW